MKHRLTFTSFLALAIAVASVFCGCGQKQNLIGTTPPEAPKNKPVVIEESPMATKIKGTGKDTGHVDLNGDGAVDTIRFTCREEAGDFTLYVNDAFVIGEGENLDGYCKVVDIDASDSVKEIAVGEAGPSDDYATAFYYYDGERVIPMGKIPGSEAGNVLKIDGSGKVATKTRGKTLHTWFYPDFYKLSEGHLLERIPQEMYEMNHKVRVIKEIKLQKSPTSTETAVVLLPGEEVVILASDDREWCLVENSKGIRGWFAFEKYDTIKGTEMSVRDVFEGLCYAD
ncbi:MAG: SH3 domain-containing protein [Bacillota bacterium]